MRVQIPFQKHNIIVVLIILLQYVTYNVNNNQSLIVQERMKSQLLYESCDREKLPSCTNSSKLRTYVGTYSWIQNDPNLTVPGILQFGTT